MKTLLYKVVVLIALVAFFGCKKSNPVGPGDDTKPKALLKVVGTTPNDTGVISKTQKLIISFDKEVDLASVAPSTFSVKSPGVIAGSRIVAGKEVSFIPYEPYQAGGQAKLYITISALDKSTLDTVITFQVKSDPVPVYLRPAQSWPANNSVDVSSETVVIKQRFNENITDVGQVSLALSSNPYAGIKTPVATSVASGDTVITTITGLFGDALPSAAQVTLTYSGQRGAHGLQNNVVLNFTVEDYNPFELSSSHFAKGIAITDKGNSIVVGSYNPGKGFIRVFSKAGRLIQEIISGQYQPYFDVAISPDGNDLYISSNDGPLGIGDGNMILHHYTYNSDNELEFVKEFNYGLGLLGRLIFIDSDLYAVTVASQQSIIRNLFTGFNFQLDFGGSMMYEDSNGDIVVIGDASGEVYIEKYNNDFSIKYWQKKYSAHLNDFVIHPRVVELNTGNYAVFALFSGSSSILERIDYTSDGVQQDPITLPLYDLYDVAKCPTHDYVLVRGTFGHGVRVVVNNTTSTYAMIQNHTVYVHDIQSLNQMYF